MTPLDVDGCDLWQVASVLGFHRPPPEPISVDTEPQTNRPRPIGSRRGARKRRVASGAAGLPTDTIRQRILHDSDPDRYPAPTPKPASAALFALAGPRLLAGQDLGEVTSDAD